MALPDLCGGIDIEPARFQASGHRQSRLIVRLMGAASTRTSTSSQTS
jgi:hypothetical protein